MRSTSGWISSFVFTAALALAVPGCSGSSSSRGSGSLAPPSPVTAAPGLEQVTITWPAVAGSTGFNIYWSTTPVVTIQTGTQVPGATSPYVHLNLIPGTTYYYVVTTLKGALEGAESVEVSATPTTLQPPTGITATAGVVDVNIAFTPDPGATSTNLYWDTVSGVTSSTGTLIAGVTSPFLHGGLTTGTTYYYVMTSRLGAFEGPDSGEVSATPTLLGPPTGITATAGVVDVTISFTPDPGATSTNLYWDTVSGVTSSTGTPIAGVTDPFLHGGLTTGTTYYYVLTSLQGAIEGPDSGEVSATPSLPGPPAGVTATAGFYQVTVDWPPVPGATSYNLYWDIIPGVTILTGNQVVGATSPFVDAPLTVGQTYYYVVTSLFGPTESGESLEVFANPFESLSHDGAAGGANDWGRAVALDSAGRILVAGHGQNLLGNNDIIVWRYDSGGVLDTTFALQGFVTVNGAAGGDQRDEAWDITEDGSGRVIVVGHSDNLNLDLDMVILVYDAMGLPDSTFGTNGVVQHHDAAGGAFEDYGWGVAIDSSDRIVVVGSSTRPGPVGDPDMVIWRYDSGGVLDPTFGAGAGFVVHGNAAGGDAWDEGDDLIIDAAGRIIVTGYSEAAGGGIAMVIWAYDSTGNLDLTFGGGGVVLNQGTAGNPNGEDFGSGIGEDSSGRILVGGVGENLALTDDMVVWRYTSVGVLDTTYGTAGSVIEIDTAGGGGSASDWGLGLVIDSTDRSFVGGTSFNANPSPSQDMAVWAHDSTGALDATFGTGGFVIRHDIAGGDGSDVGHGIAIDAQDRVYVTGNSVGAGTGNDMFLWRSP